jgi:hypothetical protein
VCSSDLEPPNNGVYLPIRHDSDNYSSLGKFAQWAFNPNYGDEFVCYQWQCQLSGCPEGAPTKVATYTNNGFLPNDPIPTASLMPGCECIDGNLKSQEKTDFTGALDEYYRIKKENNERAGRIP